MKKILIFGFAGLFLNQSLQAQWSAGTNPTTPDNVGIGTTTPNEKLSISSGWDISGCAYLGVPAFRIDWVPPGAATVCQTMTGSIPNIFEVYRNGYPMTILKDNGNLGIGTATPDSKLHILGGGHFQGKQKTDLVTISNDQTGVYNTSSALLIGYSNAQTLNPYLLQLYGNNANSAADRMVVRNDGQVGIGVADPQYKLEVAGGIIVDHDGNFAGDVNANDENNVVKFGGFASGEAIGSMRSGSNTNGLDFYTAYHSRLRITNDGSVVIGDVSTPGGYKLYVQEGILTEQIKIAIKTTNDWSDYVFNKNYKLMPLKQLEKYISQNKHLPDVPSAENVVNDGLNIAKMDATLLKKIEELTLYLLEQDKKINALQEKIITLELQK